MEIVQLQDKNNIHVYNLKYDGDILSTIARDIQQLRYFLANKLIWSINSENINILTEICGILLDSIGISDNWLISTLIVFITLVYIIICLELLSCIYAPLWAPTTVRMWIW